MDRSESAIKEQLDVLQLRCREAGVPLTPQRTAIYRHLLQSQSHPDAEALYEVVRAEFPNLSLATVYKNLEALQKLGLIHELTPLHETARFDANLEDHHHLVCTACKCVVDLYPGDLAPLSLPKPDLKGFRIARVRVQVEGLCPTCTAR